MSNVLSFKNVTLKFGGITALNSVNFSIEPGELYAIIGPNGAGKTSIFNCISGIYKPTEGEVVYGENTISKLRPDQIASLGIARTFQNIELFENLTVIDNILIGAHRKLNYGPISRTSPMIFITSETPAFGRRLSIMARSASRRRANDRARTTPPTSGDMIISFEPS